MALYGYYAGGEAAEYRGVIFCSVILRRAPTLARLEGWSSKRRGSKV
jgi:hypothetical protein